MLVPVLALAAALARGAEAPPDVPDRYQLPSELAQQEPALDPLDYSRERASKSFDDLEKTLLSSAGDEKKAYAANVWAVRLTYAYAEPRPDFWKAVDASFALLDRLLAQEPASSSRRHSIYVVFSNLVAQARGAVIEEPLDPLWRAHWDRAGELARRALADKDPKLREYFERFEPLPKTPDWRAVKARMRAQQARLLASRPNAKEALEKAWSLCRDEEQSELERKGDEDASISGEALSPADKRRLRRYVADFYDYRLYTLWANQLPKRERKKLELPPDAREPAVAPVKNGWPKY